MAWNPFRWDSLGARQRTRAFEQVRAQALKSIMPAIQAAGQRVERLAERSRGDIRSLADAFAPSDAMELQRFGFQGVTPRQAGGRTAREFFERTRRPGLPALREEEIRPLPIGGLGTGPPVTLGQPEVGARPPQLFEPSLAEMAQQPLRALERVRELEEPIAEPLAGALRLSTEQMGLPIIGPAGRPQPGRATELVEEKGLVSGLRQAGAEAPILTEFTRPTNFVPIPFVDPAVARVLGFAWKAGARVAPPMLRNLIARAERLIFTEATEAGTRRAAQQFVDEATETLAQLPAPAEQRLLPERAGVAPEPAPVTVAERPRDIPRDISVEPQIPPTRAIPGDIPAPEAVGPRAAERIAGVNIPAELRATARDVPVGGRGGEAAIRTDGIELTVYSTEAVPDLITVDIKRVAGEPTAENIIGLRNALRSVADANPGATLEGFVTNPKVRRLLQRIGGRFDGSHVEIPREVLAARPAVPGRAAAEAAPAAPGGQAEWTVPPVRGGAELPPTSRQVESASKTVPPQVRAERAAPPPDVRVPIEDWATVESRIGTRYQQNWWTKIDDVIGKVLGRNRQLEKDVRNVMIVRDEYIRGQGGRMRVGVLDWIGRNRKVLGLKTQGRRRGYAEAIQARPDAKIPKGLEQHLDHITEHPEKYIISDEQARALQERQDIFEGVLRGEQRHGVDVNALAEAYAPRVIVKTPKGVDHAAGITNVTQRFFKTRPWYTKARPVPDIEQLWAQGYRTLDSLSAMELRVATGTETIANVQSVNRIKSMGYKPSEKLRPQLLEELATARTEHQAARKAALKKGSITTDQAALAEAEVRLDQVKRDVRAEGRLLVERQPKVLGRVVLPAVKREMDRYLETIPDGAVDDFLRLARASLVTTDYGSPLLQNWFTFWRDTPTWLKSFAHGASAVPDAPYAFVVDHLDAIESGIRYGAIRAPEEFLLMRGGKLSQAVGKLPVIKESQRAFEWNIFTAQTYRWEAVKGTAKSEDQLLELASVLRKQSGSNFMPGLTVKQARWLSRTWFAPQFTSALQAAVVDPLVKSGPARREALKTIAMAFGGAAVMTVAVNQKLNGELPNMTDPDKPGFWAIRIPDAAGGGYVYPFGPFQPLMVALTRSGRAIKDVANGEVPSQRDLQAWPRFASNKVSIGVRFIMRAGEAMGLPIELLRGPSFQQPEVVRENDNLLQALQRELGGFAPIGGAQVFQGVSEGAPITGLELVGGRTTIETASQEMRRLFEQKARAGEYGPEKQRDPAYNPDVDWMRVERDPDLVGLRDQARKDAIDRGFESSMEAEERRQFLAQQERELGLPDIARRVVAGDREAMAQFTAVFQDYEGDRAVASARDFFEADERKLESEVGKAYGEWAKISRTDYWDAQALEYDYTSYFADKEAAFERIRQLDSNLANAIEERVIAQDETVRQAEAQFKAARLTYRELRKIPQYRGLSLERHDEVQDFLRRVRERKQAAERSPERAGRTVKGMEHFINKLGQEEDQPKGLIQWAQVLVNIRGMRERNLNPEYVNFILANADTPLLLFYPDLETSLVRRLRSEQGGPTQRTGATPVVPALQPAGIR